MFVSVHVVALMVTDFRKLSLMGFGEDFYKPVKGFWVCDFARLGALMLERIFQPLIEPFTSPCPLDKLAKKGTRTHLFLVLCLQGWHVGCGVLYVYVKSRGQRKKIWAVRIVCGDRCRWLGTSLMCFGRRMRLNHRMEGMNLTSVFLGGRKWIMARLQITWFNA